MSKQSALEGVIDVANLEYSRDKVRCQGVCGQLRAVLYATNNRGNICAQCLSGRLSVKNANGPA